MSPKNKVIALVGEIVVNDAYDLIVLGMLSPNDAEEWVADVLHEVEQFASAELAMLMDEFTADAEEKGSVDAN